jgi:hypothetical protein
MHDIDPKVRMRHIEFIRVNFPSLAAEAYRRFLQAGPGILLLNENDFLNRPVGQIVKYGMAFIHTDTDEFKALSVDFSADKESNWVKEYNPKTTVLIGISRIGGGLSSYRIDGVGDGTPLLCWQRTHGKMD